MKIYIIIVQDIGTYVADVIHNDAAATCVARLYTLVRTSGRQCKGMCGNNFVTRLALLLLFMPTLEHLDLGTCGKLPSLCISPTLHRILDINYNTG